MLEHHIILPAMNLAIFRLVILPLVLLPFADEPPTIKAELAPLSFFQGKWKCDGHFFNSGRQISASLNFQLDVDGSWMAFHHDDFPPNRFHALELWGYDGKAKQFVAVIVDNGSGVRLFTSPGWQGDRLVWSGDNLNGQQNPAQHFIFDKKPLHGFSVTYEVNGGDNKWKPIDVLECSQQPVEEGIKPR